MPVSIVGTFAILLLMGFSINTLTLFAMVLAISLVLCAVFVSMAFLDGITGQFYRQFAMTIAIATAISALNSLALSPALAATLLKPHGTPLDLPARIIDRLLGWAFRPFNRFFMRKAQRYESLIERRCRKLN